MPRHPRTDVDVHAVFVYNERMAAIDPDPFVVHRSSGSVLRSLLIIVVVAAGLAMLIYTGMSRTRKSLMSSDFCKIYLCAERYAFDHNLKHGDTVSFTQLADGDYLANSPCPQLEDGYGSSGWKPKHLNYYAYLTNISPFRPYDVPLAYRKFVRWTGMKVDDCPNTWRRYPPVEQTPPTTNAFLLAVRDGKTNEVIRFLEDGADPNTSDANGWTALMFSCFNDELKSSEPLYGISELLLKQGAKPDTQDMDGMTALMHAAREGHRRTVVLLLKHGADRAVLDLFGCDARRHAANSGYGGLDRLLIHTRTD